MVNNISNMLNSRLRFSGMASGLDTDSIIQQMMQVEGMKVDKVKQDKQILEWKKDDYRSITNLLRGFKDDFFDVLNPSSNMRSANTYYSYKVKSANEDVVTASSCSQVASMEHKIVVSQLAEAARIDGGNVQLLPEKESLKLSDTIEQVMDKLGLTPSEELQLNINGKEIKVAKDKTLNDLIQTINNSDAGVKISYSSFLEKFIMTSKTMGADAKIDITQSVDFFQKMGFDTSKVVEGKNAIFTLDDKTVDNHNSNIFSADGIIYTLNGLGESDITLTQDTDAIFDKIKSFIDKYNESVHMIDTKVNESRPKSGSRSGSYYLPLTDEQKEAMKEDEIKKWEENAKKGLVKNDGILNNILDNMRRAMGDITEAGGLFSIGISTGSWREGARLRIDEAKLKKAINDNPDQVMNMFAKQSSIDYDPDATKEQRIQRYNESGVVERLFDILQDNIRTTRNKDGKKGLLLEKAGVVGDLTEFQSTLVDEINKKDLLIEDMMDKLFIKQENLYLKFAALETALGRMNSQSAWLYQQLSGGQR